MARLVDGAGNVAEAAPVGAVTLDFTPPTAAAPVVTPAFARAGSTLTVVVTLSEPTGAAPALSLDPGPVLVAAPGPGANQWTFQRVLDGSEPAGAVGLVLTARDAAGNELQQRFAGAVTLDFTPPSVAAADVATPALRAGDTLVATVRFDEPVRAPPAVRLVGQDGAGAAVNPSGAGGMARVGTDAVAVTVRYRRP